MYGKFLSIFICCGWAYGYTVTLTPVQVGSNFGKLGVRFSSNNIMVTCLMLYVRVYIVMVGIDAIEIASDAI